MLRNPANKAVSHLLEVNPALGRPIIARFRLWDLLRRFRLNLGLMEDSLHANDVRLNLTSRADDPVLNCANEQAETPLNKAMKHTKDEVVFSAYVNTKPTKPASTPVVTSAETARLATMRIISPPTNSSRIANQRLTDMLGR